MASGERGEFPHLPPGHEPGRQSRSRKSGANVWAILLGLLGLFFVGLSIYGASDPGESPAWVYLVVFLPMAALTFLGGWFWVRRGRGAVTRVSKDFEVSVESTELRRGDEVHARLRLLNPEGIGEKFEIGLVCTERYDVKQVHHNPNGADSSSRETAEAVAHEEWRPADASEQLQSFSFGIPLDAPFSHEGACLSFAWRVCAREPVRMRSDEASDAPVWVRP